jgi:hypothetical protein
MAAIETVGCVHPSVLTWVYGPWSAATIVLLLALRLLVDEDFSLHGHGWGLIGSAAICFSIGCVCKVSWELARMRQAQRR